MRSNEFLVAFLCYCPPALASLFTSFMHLYIVCVQHMFCPCNTRLKTTRLQQNDSGDKKLSAPRALKEIALLSAWTYFPSYERHLTKYFPLITSQVLRWLCRHPWMFLFVSCRVKIQSLSRPRRFFCKGGKDQLTECIFRDQQVHVTFCGVCVGAGKGK